MFLLFRMPETATVISYLEPSIPTRRMGHESFQYSGYLTSEQTSDVVTLEPLKVRHTISMKLPSSSVLEAEPRYPILQYIQ